MHHTINYNPDMHIIEIKVQGTVTLDDFKELFSQGTQIAKEKGCFLFLNDFREATINVSTMEIYDLPKILSNVAIPSGINANKFKRAIVPPSKAAVDSRFAENVAANQGQNAKFFQDIDEAKKWLLEK